MNMTISVSKKGAVNPTFEAKVEGVSGIFGTGKGPFEAIGGCLRTAASMPDRSQFAMPTKLADRSDIEIGSLATNGLVDGVLVTQKE